LDPPYEDLNLKLLSKQSAHLQMAMKHCTKFRVFLISQKGEELRIIYFILSTPLRSIRTQGKVIESPCSENMHIYK
jgi:hypothetical protein